MTETTRLRALAERLAREAGALQRERYETTLSIRSKSADIDLVRFISGGDKRDQYGEDYIQEYIAPPQYLSSTIILVTTR